MHLLRIHFWKSLINKLNPCTIRLNQSLFSTTSSDVNGGSEWQQPESNDAYDTGITVYNCVHRGNVPFITRNANHLTWYTCGPTVYDDAHIGHAICYMKCDIIQRILRKHFSLNVITAMNITDIDDKIVARSAILNRSSTELAQHYEQSFWQDMDALGIQRADVIVRVTEFMPQIIAFIENLLAKGDAYVAADGSVYYINRRTNGKLKNLESSAKAATPTDTTNINMDAHTKLNASTISVRRSTNDFALWKSITKPNEPQWNVPWKYDEESVSTAGRPGWHTECAAMATELFGNTIDVHAGGIDLKFPHHENEEAQCCSYHNRKQWVNYWLHIGHLVTTENVKMSKSLKNTISIKEFLKHYPRDQLRIACLLTTYHQHIEFSDEILLTTGDLLKRFISFFDDTERFLQHSFHISNRNEIMHGIQKTTEKIDFALKNDFDTRACIASLNELITLINKSINPKHLKQQSRTNEFHHACESGFGIDAIKCGQNVVRNFLEMVGLHDIIHRAFPQQNTAAAVAADGPSSIQIENLINDILLYRTKILGDAKINKDKKLFEICDHLRSIMRQNGLVVKDFGGQSSWTFDNIVSRKNQTKNE